MQIDEPYLVHDLTDEDIRLFTSLYEKILESKGNVKVILQTYFGDIRDCYKQVINMNFDGIGLDLLREQRQQSYWMFHSKRNIRTIRNFLQKTVGLLTLKSIRKFPQTADVKAKRTEYKKGLLSDEEYETFIKEKIAECIHFQEEIGLDVLVHGEYERNDMVEYFGEQLDGYLFMRRALQTNR